MSTSRSWESGTAAEIHFFLRTLENLKSGTSKHGLDAGSIRYPPIRGIVSKAVLDKVEAGHVVAIKYLCLGKRIISCERSRFP
jgi:hypothetical protein